MMKRKIIFAAGAAALCAVLFVFTACGGESEEKETPVVPETDAQVYLAGEGHVGYGDAYTGSGTLKFYVAEGQTIDTGAIVNGKLTISLPAVSAEYEYLRTVAETFFPDITDEEGSIAVSPEDAKVWWPPFTLFDENDEYVDGIYFQKSSLADSVETSDYIMYLYLDKAAAITGTHTYKAASRAVADSFEIAGRAGWNKIYLHASVNTDTRAMDRTFTTDLSGVPAGLRWTFAWNTE
jgi:hypothetical protein